MRTLSVIAQNSADGLYYPGYINANNPGDASASVHFYSLKPQEVQRQHIIVVGGASPCPNLVIGDFVLVQVQYNTTQAVLYVPGMVLAPPSSRDYFTKNFLVKTYTNVVVETPRRGLIKIGESKHEDILAYIRELNPRMNPLFRSDPSQGVSVLRRRRLIQNAPVYSIAVFKPRTEVLFAHRIWRSAHYRKAKARHLLTASLQSRSTPVLRFPGREPFTECKEPTRRNEQLKFLRDFVKSQDENIDRREEQDFHPVKVKEKNKGHNISGNVVNKKVKNHDSALFLEDLNDGLCDTENFKDSGDGGKVSPTYSADTFEASDNEVSNKSDVSLSNHSNHSESKTGYLDKRPTNVKLQRPKRIRSLYSESKKTYSVRSSNQSLNGPSHSTSQRTSSRTSGTQTPQSKPDRHRHDSTGSDADSDVTRLTNRTITNDVIGQGEEVLARWADDGWYYFGIVVTEVDGDKYVVVDSTGFKETIDRRYMLTDGEQSFQVLQPGDGVIALHPNYVFSYAPALVKEVYHSTGVTVEFFDKTRAKIPTTEAYKINKDIHKKSVNYLLECENRLVTSKSPVVAREDKSGYYLQCMIECPTNVNQHYFVRLPDMTFAKQSAIHMFTFQSRDNKHEQLLEYVLAPVDQDDAVYLPACVVQNRPLRVKYCNGRVSNDLLPTRCFYISKDYYDNAVYFFRHVQAKNKAFEEIRQFERLKSTWHQRDSDICSDNSSHYRSVDTSQSSESISGTKDTSSEKAPKYAFISKKMLYNPDVYGGFRRKHKSHHTFIYQQHP